MTRSVQRPIVDQEKVEAAEVRVEYLNVTAYDSVGFQWVQHEVGGDIASIEFAVTCATIDGQEREAKVFDPSYEGWWPHPDLVFATLPAGVVGTGRPLLIRCLAYSAIKITLTGGAGDVPSMSLFSVGRMID